MRIKIIVFLPSKKKLIFRFWTPKTAFSFPSHESLHEHSEQQSPQKCEICSHEFCTLVELDAHRQQGCEGLIEIGANPEDCKPTAIDYNSELNSEDNSDAVEATVPKRSKKVQKCDKCDRIFSKRSNLNRHRRLMHSKRTKKSESGHKCTLCDRIFTKKCNLNRHHRLLHTSNTDRDRKAELVQQCEVCDRVCENELGLKLHRRTHIDEHPFKCDECDRYFTKKSNLLRHSRQAHSDQRPFQCEECGQSFKDRYVLANHQTRHTDEQPFECWLCHRM